MAIEISNDMDLMTATLRELGAPDFQQIAQDQTEYTVFPKWFKKEKAMVHDGVLVPNSELGHLELDGHDAETRASNRARETEGLSWEAWAARLQRYYSHLEFIFSPDLFVVGGGVSKSSEMFLPLLRLDTPIVPAMLRNNAGIIGAAALARGV